MQSQGQQNMKLKIIAIPYLPGQVDLDDVTEVNGKLSLLPANAIKQIRQEIEIRKLSGPETTRRFSKSELQQYGVPATYSIIKAENRYYAVYKGVKQQKEVGYGSFGTVKLALDLETFEWVSLKTQAETHETPEGLKQRLKADVRERGANEYQMLKKAGEAKTAFERQSLTKGYQYSVLTRLAKGNELFIYCKKLTSDNRNLPTVQWLQIAKGICMAIQSLHDDHQLLHCDIKSENFIYYPATGEIRIIDFGEARDAANTKNANNESLKGTYGFIAPETLREKKYSKKSDIYALGVTLLELLKLGHFNTSMQFVAFSETDFQFKNNQRIRNESARREILHYMRDRLMATDPEQRPSAAEVTQFLARMQKNYLSLSARATSIGILNIEEYVNCKAKDQVEMLIALNKFDKVVFVDTKNRGQKNYIALTRQFAALGITTANQVYISPDEMEAVAGIPCQLESEQSQEIYAYFHVTKKPFDQRRLECQRIKTLTPEQTDNGITGYFTNLPMYANQYNLLKNNLQSEIIRLLNTKIEALMTQAETVARTALEFEERYRRKLLSYGDVYAGLIYLQSNVSVTRCVGSFFSKKPEQPAEAESTALKNAFTASVQAN